MDETTAGYIAEYWSGGAGLVPRGPRSLLAVVQVTPTEVERHTGRRPSYGDDVWRIEVSGRFLRSGGTVYPGGVPFPEELHSQTAIIANEVWLYTNDDGDVLGSYWWPDAVRRPIAAQPQADYEFVQSFEDACKDAPFDVKYSTGLSYEPNAAVWIDDSELMVFYTTGQLPDPLNAMVVYEGGGISHRMQRDRDKPSFDSFLQSNQPPFRQVKVRAAQGIGRDVGRALGPQTWPWPAELRWWEIGVSHELKAFAPLNDLVEFALTLS